METVTRGIIPIAGRTVLFVAILSLAPGLAASAQTQTPSEAAAAREIVDRWQDAIVSVRVVLKMRMVVGGREMQASDETVETVGTVIDPSGLTVLSLASLNPGEMMGRVMSRAAGAGEGPGFELTSEPVELRLRLADGRELPATIVLRDQDLDLAFLRPVETPAAPLKALKLTEDARPMLLDPVVVLSRLGRVGNWSPSAALRAVHAIIDRPRTMYVTEVANPLGGMGTPVFLLNGRLLGFLALRSVDTGRTGMLAMMGGSEGMGLLPVIIPAADVREVAAQALEKK